jgi:hypothetical protein
MVIVHLTFEVITVPGGQAIRYLLCGSPRCQQTSLSTRPCAQNNETSAAHVADNVKFTACSNSLLCLCLLTS